MGIDIREVVANYVLNISGHRVHARITRDIDQSGGFLWDVSHYRGGFGKSRKPSVVTAGSREEALEQIIAYAQGFDPQYSPVPNGGF